MLPLALRPQEQKGLCWYIGGPGLCDHVLEPHRQCIKTRIWKPEALNLLVMCGLKTVTVNCSFVPLRMGEYYRYEVFGLNNLIADSLVNIVAGASPVY